MKKLLLFYLITFTLYLASPQTAAELDTLLQTETVSIATTARFVLGAADLLPAGLTGGEPRLSGSAGNTGTAAQTAAYQMALERGWTKKSAAENATLQDTAFLIMNAFDLKGGIMYTLFRNPRYAYREMVYRRLIQGRAYSTMTASGQRLLHIIGRTINE